MQLPELKGKVAVVTGGSKGIGRSIVEKLTELGCSVYFISRNPTDGEKLEKELRARGRDATYFSGDVGKQKDVAAFISSVLRKGTIDYLVNNAGIFHIRPLEKENESDFDEIVNTNLRGTFLMTREVIPVLKQKKSGVIVNLGSMSGYKAEKETVLYSMTKAAVIAFSRVLGVELAAQNIRVVSVSPGNVATPLIKKSVEDEAAFRKVDKRTVESEYGRISMLHRMAEPDEIASVVAFCLSDSASFITGSDILVDGGSVAKSYELS